MEEIWKPIEGFEDYEASSLGRIKSYKKRNPTILKGSIDSRGYIQTYVEGKTRLTHRLIASTFIENKEIY